MSLIRNLQYRFQLLFEIIQHVIVMFKYNEYTIAEHFRKQGAKIGENCRIAVYTLGNQPYLVSIGNHVFIAQGAIFHTHDGGTWICEEEIPDIAVYGKIIVENNCLIGAKSHLLPNITIGRNSIIGAGSVIISDVPPDSIVMGIPARVVGSSLKYREKCIATWNEQKLPGHTRMETRRFGQKANRKNKQEIKMHLTRIFDSLDKAIPPPT